MAGLDLDEGYGNLNGVVGSWVGCLGMEDWATESGIVEGWSEGWDWTWICGVGSLALCALARKQKFWDWTRIPGRRRMGDGWHGFDQEVSKALRQTTCWPWCDHEILRVLAEKGWVDGLICI